MCVIVYKPAKSILKESVIRDCFKTNDDGAGFTVINSDGVFTRKGYMTVESLLEDLSVFKGECEVILHFRISTSGVINPVNCHPYPVTNKPEIYTRLVLDNTDVIYHNGVIVSKVTSWSNDIDVYSDTMLLARDILSKSYPQGRVNILTLISNTTTNKFITVSKRGEVTLYGHFTERDGVFYSNMYWSFKPVTVVTTPLVTGKGSKSYDYKYDWQCKKCKTYLYPYERNSEDGLCTECHTTETFKRFKNKKLSPVKSETTTERHCPECGVRLVSHETVLCDDCLEFYGKYANLINSQSNED